MKIYGLSYEAYEQYKLAVKGNETTTYELAKLKLNRNIMLGYKAKDDGVIQCFKYGRLKIDVAFDEIIGVSNHGRKSRKWELDQCKYEKLNHELGIVNLEENQLTPV